MTEKNLKNSLTIALNVLYIDSESYFTDIEKNIWPKFKKKKSFKDSEQSRIGYMVVIKLSLLLKRISTF